MACVLLPASYLNLGASRQALANAKPYQRYAGATAWLQVNTPTGARVFQADWDDFPRLFYYNTHNTYTLGLDPTYMQLYDPDLFELWVDISKGRVEQPSISIGQRFGADYVITDLNLTHEQLSAALVELTPDQQHVVTLRFGQGLSHREVAQIMGKSEGAIKLLQFRALQTLRRLLEPVQA